MAFHVLFEHASGYAIFSIREFEEIGALEAELTSSVSDPSRFASIVKLVAYAPFKNAASSLENMQAVSEGNMHNDLRAILETSLPKPQAKKEGKRHSDHAKVQLGVADPKLGANITEQTGISCTHLGAVPEIIRGVRMHFTKLVRGLSEQNADAAQRALAHSFSRAKVKFNVNRIDNMIIQSIALLDQLDKDINTFAMRVREWYSYHFPELLKLVPEQQLYCRVVDLIRDRTTLSPDRLSSLAQLLMDETKAKQILEASKSSMGMDISALDLANIGLLTRRVIGMIDYRRSLHEYLSHKMQQVAPNLAALIGELVGARLISHAGSLTNLAKYPASTVQILGAEKALFRALKSRGKCKTPKYGLIFHSTFIARAAARNKGRISRYLANKCSIASRIDCFYGSGEQGAFLPNTFGRMLRDQVEERLKFIDAAIKSLGGPSTRPRKNIEIMKAALTLCLQESKLFTPSRKSLPSTKSPLALTNGGSHGEAMDVSETGEKQKKHKKKKKQEETNGYLGEEAQEQTHDSTLESTVAAAGGKRKRKHVVEVVEQEPEPEIEPAIDTDADLEAKAAAKKAAKKKHKAEKLAARLASGDLT